MSARLIDALATTEPLAEVFSDSSLLDAMLRFEVALARVQARLHLIPAAAAAHIEAAADRDAFDPAALATAARASGTIALPLVETLRARVHALDPASATYVHWGATSQDVIDSALVCCLARARPHLADDHDRLIRSLRALSDAHAGTVMLARTIMQPAPPTTFGLKVAGWFAACQRSWARLVAAYDDALVLQCGGASGTLAALGADGPAVADALARELGLAVPDGPWHAHRDRLATLVSACGVCTAVLGKIARDVTLLAQAEVAEVRVPGGGSSSMPHKRNPSGCAIVLAAATRVPGLVGSFLAGAVQEHERGVGGWHAEAPTVAAVVEATGAAFSATREVVAGIRVDAARMAANIGATRGAIVAERALAILAPRWDRERALTVIDDALRLSAERGTTFAVELASRADAAAAFSREELAELEQPHRYLGAAEIMRRRLLDGG